MEGGVEAGAGAKADLDGALLIRNDPFEGTRIVDGVLHLVAFTPTNEQADETVQAMSPRPIAEFPPFGLVRLIAGSGSWMVNAAFP